MRRTGAGLGQGTGYFRVGLLGFALAFLSLFAYGCQPRQATTPRAQNAPPAEQPQNAPSAGQPQNAPSAGQPQINPQDLNQVLQRSGLPRTFMYGGKKWQADASGQFEKTIRLMEFGPKVDGHPLYYEKGTPTKPYQTIYMKALDYGPKEAIFVRYKPVS